MTNVLANLDKLLEFHYKHQKLQQRIATLETQLKLAEAIILLRNNSCKDLQVANMIIDLSN